MSIYYSDQFPVLTAMEDSYDDIRYEFDKFYATNSIRLIQTTGHFKNMQKYKVKITGKGISIILFEIGIDKHNQVTEQYREHFPHTYKLIEPCKTCIPIRLFFNILYPNSSLEPHTDSYAKTVEYNGQKYERMRSHMGIHVPSDCYFKINFKKVNWEEGKAFAWYPSDIHYAQNNSKELRTILILDFLFILDCNDEEFFFKNLL